MMLKILISSEMFSAGEYMCGPHAMCVRGIRKRRRLGKALLRVHIPIFAWMRHADSCGDQRIPDTEFWNPRWNDS
jgi:hypothetical protein